MWIYVLCMTVLLNLASYSVLSNLQERQDSSSGIVFPSDGASFQSFDDVYEIKSNIEVQLQEQQNYFLGKLENLEASCKSENTTSQQVISNRDNNEGFKNPQMEVLVAVMVEKLMAIETIIMDELTEKLQHFSTAMSTRIQEKFSQITNDVSELQNQMNGLVKKTAFIQLKTNVSAQVATNTAAIKNHLSILATKLDVTTETHRLDSSSNDLQLIVEALKDCQNSTPLLENIENAVTKSKENVVELKKNIMSKTSRASTCPTTPEELLLSLNEVAQENNDAIRKLSVTAESAQPNHASRLEEIHEILKEVINDNDASETLTTTTTTTAAAARATITTTIRPSIPSNCLNSHFVSEGFSPDVCRTSILLKKCHLEYIAFHCCRSCMEAGFITSLPTRFIAPRSVPILQALRALITAPP